MEDEAPLSRPERQWLEQRRLDAARKAAEEAGRRPPSVRRRVQRATDCWSREASWVALGLTGASATSPPTRTGERIRRGSSVADPTGSQLFATLDTIGREAEAWAHLAGPCVRDGLRDETGRVHECPHGSAVDLACLADVHLDPEDIVDGLIGTPPSSAHAFAAVCHRAASWHTTTAAQLLDRFQQAWRDGAEPARLDTWATATEQLARRTTAIAGRLAAWSGRTELRCAAGCGGAKPAGRATCDRCRQRSSRGSAADP